MRTRKVTVRYCLRTPIKFKIANLSFSIFSQRIINFYIMIGCSSSKADFSIFSGSQLNFSSIHIKVRICTGFIYTHVGIVIVQF